MGLLLQVEALQDEEIHRELKTAADWGRGPNKYQYHFQALFEVSDAISLFGICGATSM